MLKILNKEISISALCERIRVIIRSFVKPFHPTSSPFLSGDTFRSFCHVQIDDSAVNSDISKKILELTGFRNEATIRLFLDLHVLLTEEQQAFMTNLLTQVPVEIRQKTSILFHNTDKLPPQNFFAQLFEIGYVLYCVNIVKADKSVSPLPIGLENRWRLNNGRIRQFTKSRSKINSRNRNRQMVFAAFTVGTNPIERQAARAACLKAGFPFNEGRISPRRHRKQLMNSYFVISPPGNGLDCHRTWEAIYLGCIPIVLRSALAEEFTRNLPIFAVDDWGDFFNLSDDQKFALYQQLCKCSTDLAFDTIWRRKLGVISAS